ncbi:MAG TPA: hypothetical protein VGF48_20715 [Thermoanaerobaculia bacterium]|jgi:hypothetical protein
MTKFAVAFALLAALSASATPIDVKYAELGGSAGFLGAASEAEKTSTDAVGSFRHYANGSIYFHPATGAHEVHGLIRQKFLALGGETGTLGYPMTDEIGLFDGSGKVSKFQLGEVIWRTGSTTVEVVRSIDLIVDPPFRAGEAWLIVQANAPASGGSHNGSWAYCWDYVLALPPNTTSEAKPFVAAAGAKLTWVQQDLTGPNNAGNVVVQRFGEGRYGSYLHIRNGSYTKHFGGGILPQSLPWEQRPAPGSGRFLGEVGNTGTDGSHMHFCVTTTPDRGAFAPFESVPVAFRNYSFSTDSGVTWKLVPLGVPKAGQWIRREPHQAGQLSAAQINNNVTVISYGTVKGQVTLGAGEGKPSGAGTITLRLETAWGELLGSKTISVLAGAPNGPWPFEFTKVPAFKAHKLTAAYSGTWSPAATKVGASSAAFDVAPNGAASQTLALEKMP